MLTRLFVRAESSFRSVAARRRGAGFLEYALVALISVIIFGLILTLFKSQISSLFTSISQKINGTSSAG